MQLETNNHTQSGLHQLATVLVMMLFCIALPTTLQCPECVSLIKWGITIHVPYLPQTNTGAPLMIFVSSAAPGVQLMRRRHKPHSQC